MTHERLFQMLSINSRCKLTNMPAQVIHHIINRGQSKILRFDIVNAYPLINEKHNNDIEKCTERNIPNINEKRREYLTKMRNTDFKDYLIKHSISEEEFLEKQKEKLQNCLYCLSCGGNLDNYIDGILKSEEIWK